MFLKKVYKMESIKIQNKEVGIYSKPLIIAEMSGCHNQSLDRALEIVEIAAKSGADCLKIQTYTPDTMTLNIKENEFYIQDKNLWTGKSLYELYSEAQTPWEWHLPIFEKAKSLGMIPFSSPFDESAVDFLENLNVPCYKIASAEIIDIPLIKKVAKTKKPIILSTGMASLTEISEAVETAKYHGCKDLILLKCTSTYPSDPINSNIRTIKNLRETFNCEVGISDHTMGIGVAIASIAYGATVIEKHLTLDRNDGGVDSAYSLEPKEFKELVIESERAWQSLGQIKYGPTNAELNSLRYRRSIYISSDIKKGEKISKNNIKCIRPGLGLPPKFYDLLIGKSVNQDLLAGTALDWDKIN
jgi:pseudaminic acid synthase